MTIKVGINGFGRIGRMVFRAAVQNFNSDIQIVAINDLLEPDYLAYMLKYDSVHGRFKGDIAVEGGTLIVNGKKIRLTAEKDPAALKWGDVGADVVVESTGLFLTLDTCQKHLDAGAKKVIQSAPSKDDTPMFVYGVNHTKYAGEKIISNASCTTNCLAPVAKVLQRQLRHQARPDDDGACDDGDAEDGRWPEQQGLARRPRHPGEHHPEQHRRGQGGGQGDPRAEQEAHRHVVSRADLGRVGDRPHGRAVKDTTYEAICAAMKSASQGAMKGVLGYTEEKVVSTDFRGEAMTSVFDAEAGIMLDPTFVKVIAWYDNEWGYSNKVLEMVRVAGKG